MASANRIPALIAELRKLDRMSIVIGVPIDDDFLQMVASVNETGLTIKAKGKWLTIPTAAAKGKKGSEIQGLFKPKGKNILAVADKSSYNGLKVMFILKESVTIPPRPFIRYTFNHRQDKWDSLINQHLQRIMDGEGSADELMSALGRQVSNDIKKTIRDFKSPANAPLTVANKGFDDPLMDTGKLIGSITWKIERE